MLSVRTRRAERPDAWPPAEVGLDPCEQARELILKENERDDDRDPQEHDAHHELEVLGTAIAWRATHTLRTRRPSRRVSPEWGTNDQTKRSGFHSMPSSLGGPIYPSSAEEATTAGLAR